MLNLKKGLALVLAAATAFTFAPVANLERTVDASAASVKSTVNASLILPELAFSETGTKDAVAPTQTTAGYTKITQAPLANGMKIQDLTVTSKNKNSVYQIYQIDDTNIDSYEDVARTKPKTFSGTPVYSDLDTAVAEAAKLTSTGAVAKTGDAGFAVNNYVVSNSDSIIHLGDIYLHSGGSHTFYLYDLGADGDGKTTTGEMIKVTVSTTQNKEEAPAAHLYATQFASANAAVTLKGSEIIPQGFTYYLDLNKYDPGYLLTYSNNSDGKKTSEYVPAAGGGGTATDAEPKAATAGSATGLYYTNWAGSKIAVTQIKLTGASRGIEWWVPGTSGKKADSKYTTARTQTLDAKVDDADNPGEYTYDNAVASGALDAKVYDGTGNPNGIIFKTTAPTIDSDSIVAEFVGDNGSSLSTNDSDVKFSTDQSEASLDHLYVNNTNNELPADPVTGQYDYSDLDVQIKNSGKFIVDSESGDYRFISVDPSIITIDEKTGEFKVLKKGTTKINLYLGSTVNNKPNVYTINITVSPLAHDVIDLSSDAGVELYKLSNEWYLDLDEPGNKSTNPVTTAQIKAISKGGLDVKFKSDDSSIASVDEKTGVVTAKKAGTTTITAKTTNSVDKEVAGTTEYIHVTVWKLPAAQFTVDPITVNTNETVLVQPVITLPAKDATYTINYDNGNTSDEHFTLTNPNSLHQNTQTSSRIKGDKIGTSSILVTVIGTANTRPTTKRVGVTVLDKTSVNTISVATGSESVVLEEGGTATVTAKSTKDKDVTFTSDDPTVATVAATTGSAIVTAVKAGKTTIKAHSEGAEDVIIPVVVTAKASANDVAVPGKVAKIKLYQANGAKLKINYSKIKGVAGYKVVYKYKKNGKQVRKTYVTTAGSKTVTVPKNTSVKVWVRAYNVNASGQRVNGAYKTATKKTDKK